MTASGRPDSNPTGEPNGAPLAPFGPTTGKGAELILVLRIELSQAQRERALAIPPREGKLRIVLDTDTKNEIDDQFAVVYTLLSPRLQCEAIYAAPFYKPEYPSAKAGMEASYDEILTVLGRMGERGKGHRVLKGSDAWLTDTQKPVESPAVHDLIECCLATPESELLYVVAIGALTNIASALWLEPKIAEKMVLLWLGGHPEAWPNTHEYNLQGDMFASKLVLDSGVPMVRFPCKNVAEHIRSTPAEMDRYIRPCGAIGEYLAEIFTNYIPGEVRSKVIWDLLPIAWLNEPRWAPTELRPTPILRDDYTWDLSDTSRPIYRVAVDADRDGILGHFVALMQEAFG